MSLTPFHLQGSAQCLAYSGCRCSINTLEERKEERKGWRKGGREGGEKGGRKEEKARKGREGKGREGKGREGRKFISAGPSMDSDGRYRDQDPTL